MNDIKWYTHLSFNLAWNIAESKNKRIRYNLKVAVKNRDRKKLPPAVEEFKKAKLPDDDMDLAAAEKLLKEFKARNGKSLHSSAD